jgi:hypothetical protein
VPPALTAAPTTSRARQELRAFVELFALSGFAIAQPLLDLFGRAPAQFVFRGAGRGEVVAVALVVVLAPPMALWVLGAVVRAVSAATGRIVHLCSLAALAWALAVQAARPLVGGTILLVAAAAVAAAFLVLHARYRPIRLWVAYAAVGPAVFLFLFLAASDTSRLITSSDVPALGAEVAAPAPVVIIVFDELPLSSLLGTDGDIDAELFPNFAEVASTSHWFRNSTGVTQLTSYAVPSLLTGAMPRDGAGPFASDHPQNLFTLLAPGYDLNVTESFTQLCPPNLCPLDSGGIDAVVRLLGDGADLMRARLSRSGDAGPVTAGLVEQPVLPAVSGTALERRYAELTAGPDRVERFIDGVVDDRLAVHFLHVLLPHAPFRLLPSGREYGRPLSDPGRDGDTWTSQPGPTELSRQRHLLQLAYTDAQLGRIVDRLRDRGVWDQALVVVTADHGIGFRPGAPVRLIEGQEPTARAAADVLWVPLLVKRPGQQEGVVSDANVLAVDVLPSIADVLDMPLPDGVAGRSVFGPGRASEVKPFVPAEFGARVPTVGEQVDIDGREGLEEALAIPAGGFVGPEGDARRFWWFGTDKSLVGTSADDLPRLDAWLLDPTPDLDPASGQVPALVYAEMRESAPGDRVAVAVNGVVGGTGIVFDHEGKHVIWVMVAEELFGPGQNEVTVHALEAG